jgi:hypothetical protein
MMKYALPLIALLLATPAAAKDVTITLNDEEQKVFLALLDAALKQGGLSNLQVVAQFVQKYQQAIGPVAPKPAEAPKKP